jgi:hypothetical protein
MLDLIIYSKISKVFFKSDVFKTQKRTSNVIRIPYSKLIDGNTHI